MTTLSNQDKLSIVNQHLKSIDYSLYNIELDILEANAEGTPSTDTLSMLNAKAESLTAKRAVLQSEADSLSE